MLYGFNHPTFNSQSLEAELILFLHKLLSVFRDAMMEEARVIKWAPMLYFRELHPSPK